MTSDGNRERPLARILPALLVALVQNVLFWVFYIHESPEYIIRNDDIVAVLACISFS